MARLEQGRMKSDAILAAQVDICYQNFPLLVGINLLSAMLFAGVMAYRVDSLIIGSWLGFATLVVLSRYFFYRRYSVSAMPEQEARRWYQHLQLGVFLGGVVWGSAALFYLLIDDVQLRAFNVLIVLVAVLSGILWHVALPGMRSIYVLLPTLPIVLTMFVEGDQLDIALSGVSVVLIVSFYALLHRSGTLVTKFSIQSAQAHDQMICLKESQRLLGEAEQLAHIGHWDWDYEHQHGSFSAEARRILALPSGLNPSLAEIAARVVDRNGTSVVALVTQASLDQREEIFLEHSIGVGSALGLAYTRVRIIYGADHALLRFVAVTQDVSELHAYRHQLHLLTNTDPLTGLPNRTRLNEYMLQTMTEITGPQESMGLMVLGLDGFKAIVETLDHAAGDQLLRELASRLVDCVRHYDTVARLGADEFAILLPRIFDSADLGNIALKLIAATVEPFRLENTELFVTCSIGIALYKSDSNNAPDLLRFADAAMSHAKKAGPNRFQYYSAELTTRTAERLAIHAQLRQAIPNGELELYFQPQIDLNSTRLIGVEALLRWNHPSHGLVMPDRFIGVAEETGLIVPIGAWVLRDGCRMAHRLNHGRVGEVIKVAINLSPRQFHMNDLIGTIRRALEETCCQPEWLECEITESLLLDDSEVVRNILREIKGLGVSLSIDDFGTGYSSLGYLNRYPVQSIKIDRSFVQDIVSNPEAAELVKAILSMAHSLRLDVVAEGVETSEQEAFLKRHGCHAGQGWLYGKAVPQTKLEEEIFKERPIYS